MLVASQVAPGKPEILHYPDLTDEVRERLHGSGRHTPLSKLTVSDWTTVTFDFTIGETPVVTGGELLVVWRWPFDWGDLQADDPDADGLMTVAWEGSDPNRDAPELALRYNWIAGIEPWHHQIQVRVRAGELQPGDRIRLVCGDTNGQCRGWRAPTCAAARCHFLMLIDHQGNGKRTRLPQQPLFRVTAGEATRIVAVVVADAVVGQPADVVVRAEDSWGNATTLTEPPVIRSVNGTPCTVELKPHSSPHPATHFQVTFPATGTFCLQATAGTMTTETNPVVVHESPPEYRLFWGDLHSGQSEIGCGAGSLGENYEFARDCAGLQFITHQANDHYVTLDDWRETQDVTDAHHLPGKFVTILGCEWSALTNAGGDRNVFYRENTPELRRSGRFFREANPDPTPDATTAPAFHNAFRDTDVLVNIHVGGRMTNLEWYEPRIEKLCELHSTHGTVEWFFRDAISKGYRVGATAGTDGVMGRPGACHPGRRLIRNLRNGLTAVYAKDLTRESLWEAFHNRRCYATSGSRIRLWFEVDGHPLGAEISSSGPRSIKFEITGTEPLERVDLFRGVEIIESWQVAPLVPPEAETLRLLWGGTERKGTARLQKVLWDGSLTISKGTLELLDTVNFQSIEDAAYLTAPNRIEWNSKTAGNDAGLNFRVVGHPESLLTFETGPKTFVSRLGDVMQNEVAMEAGGLNRRVKLGRPPEAAGPREFACTTSDATILSDTAPYWIRVTQIDQSLAWSSPVYVTPESNINS